MNYSVYAIYNFSAEKLYVGETDNLPKRLKEHNGELPNPSQYTKKFKGKWRMIHSEDFASRSEARKREKQLKSYRGRLFLKSKI